MLTVATVAFVFGAACAVAVLLFLDRRTPHD